jgi:hypothetical protein
VPPEHRDAARDLLAQGLLRGELEHPSRGRVVRAWRELREYWLRSGGALTAASDEAIQVLVRDQLGDVASWEDFANTPIALDVGALVPPEERAHLDSLPSSVQVFGDRAPLEYRVEAGGPAVVLILREGMLRRLREDQLPTFDRPLRFGVRRGEQLLEATTLARLRELTSEHDARDLRERHRDRGPRGGGRGGPRRGGGGPPRGRGRPHGRRGPRRGR